MPIFLCQDVTDNRTFAVTIPHHRCSKSGKAWDRLVSAVRMLIILGFFHDVSLASGGADVHQPNRIAVEQANGKHVSAQSRGRSLRVVVLAVWRWSS